ncbi:DUF1643 domain-containing protein [Bacillus altitudinis]|uniref:DUF1643 domain-containing protein n=1 Tax=Bacillus altitudinis TaxID=293387 RepID=UPI003F7C765F
MRIKKSTIVTEVVFDNEMNNKFLLRKEWNLNKKKALVIMKKAGQANEMLLDRTTMYVMNNLSRLGYGGVNIVNLFPTVKGKETKEAIRGNLKCIQEAFESSDDVIIAVGKGAETNIKAIKRLKSILDKLLDKKAKIFEIESNSGRKGFHPLYPELQNQWKLVPYSREKE